MSEVPHVLKHPKWLLCYLGEDQSWLPQTLCFPQSVFVDPKSWIIPLSQQYPFLCKKPGMLCNVSQRKHVLNCFALWSELTVIPFFSKIMLCLSMAKIRLIGSDSRYPGSGAAKIKLGKPSFILTPSSSFLPACWKTCRRITTIIEE